MQSHDIDVSFKARYFYKSAEGTCKHKICLLHGYGQLAETFVHEFEGLAKESIDLVLPEGLSRFYIRRGRGEVGASWMTKEVRHVDIENAMNYLSQVYQKAQLSANDYLLGFSQGAEMASRMFLTHDFKVLVLWGGKLADECFKPENLERLKNKKIYFVQGNSDHIFSNENAEQLERKCRENGLVLKVIKFEGGHEVKKEVVTELFDLIKKG